MKAEIVEAIKAGNVVLFLGAGAALCCKSKNGEYLPTSAGLARDLAANASLDYKGEALAQVYKAANRKLGDSLFDYMRLRFQGTTPSEQLRTISRYPFPRIYTTNIDDSLEAAFTLERMSYTPRSRKDKIIDIDCTYKDTQIVYLNGSIRQLSDGVLFSPNEYGKETAITSPWYREIASDFHRFTFIFIGTKLNEPVFFQEVEHFRQYFGSKNRRHYLVCPGASQIEVEGIADENIEYIDASFEGFCSELVKSISPPPTPISVVYARNPELNLIPLFRPDSENILHFTKFQKIDNQLVGYADKRKRIRNFYRGFKPTWQDIVDSIPANLHFLGVAQAAVEELAGQRGVIAIIGPAGSGKTTVLMQVAYWLGRSKNSPVFYLLEPINELDKYLLHLDDAIKAPYYLFIDKVSAVSDRISDYYSKSKSKHATIVCTERLSAWENRTRDQLDSTSLTEIKTDVINRDDAELILDKLSDYAPFAKLEKISHARQVEIIFNKAQRQLLIGLLEATTGEGFDDIIRNDYLSLGSDDDRHFVGLVGLATIHRLPMPEGLLSRAMSETGFASGIEEFVRRTAGVVSRGSAGLNARHSVYVEHLFENIIDLEEKKYLITSLLDSFEVYETPLARNIGRLENSIFKLTVNNRFLRNQFREDRVLVLSIFQRYEKFFSSDGLFWLQYGICLRTFGMHPEALEKLNQAKELYAIKQTLHAYAQQLLINAFERDDATRALAMAEEARGLLRDLDASKEIGEYPLVTLSEHHVRVADKHQGRPAAKEIAANYMAELMNRTRGKKNIRAEGAVNYLFRFINYNELGVPTFDEPI